MSIITYKYVYTPSKIKKELIPLYTPVIPIRLSVHHRLYLYDIDCLLDSGADFNLFPGFIAESLGIKISKGVKITHMGIGNIGITAYSHPVQIFVKDYSFKTDIHFSNDQKIPLLGRYGFFKFFNKVTFNQKLSEINLEK